MANMRYLDPGTGRWRIIDISFSPKEGSDGPVGPPGPTAVSAAPGNIATIDPDDGGIYVSTVVTSGTDALYLQATGGTMAGTLLLPDPADTPPSVPTAAVAKQYVDELITVSAVEPVGLPPRDGAMWVVVVDHLDPPTSAVGTWTSATMNTITWVDNPDPDVTGYEVHYSVGATRSARMTENTPVHVAPGVQTLVHVKDAAAQTAGTLHYTIRAVSATTVSEPVQVAVSVPPPGPPASLAGTWTLPTNMLTWVDSTGTMVAGYEVFYNVSGAPVVETDSSLGMVLPGIQTAIHTKSPEETTAGNVFYGVRAVGIGGGSGLAQVTVVNEGLPPGPTDFTGTWTSPTTNTLTWADSTDATATYEIRCNLDGAIVGDGDILLETGILPGTLTYVHNQDVLAQAAPRLSYGIKAVGVAGSSAWVPTFIDGPALSGWTGRPPGWLPIYIPKGSDSIQVTSFIPSSGSTTVAFMVSGAYTVIWGDGTAPEHFAGSTTASHTYSYPALGSALPDGRRQAAAIITPQAGSALNSFYFTDSPASQPIGEVVFGSRGVTNGPASSLSEINRVLVEHIEYLSPTVMPNAALAFSRLNRLTRVTGPLDTSLATSFRGTFQFCHSLVTVPALNSAAGTDFYSAFRESGITSVPAWNFSKGQDFGAAFYRCPSLASVSLSAPKGIDFLWAFGYCGALTTASVVSSTATNLRSVFGSCGALVNATLSTSKGTDFDWAFDSCTSLTTASVSTASATTMRYMFSNCRSLTTGPSMSTGNVVEFEGLFNLCSALRTVPTYSTVNGVDFGHMFAYCTSLTAVPGFDAAAGRTFGGMTNGCGSSITSILMRNVKYQISIKNLGLDAAALNTFFGRLGPAVDPAGNHLWCDGNPGSSTCSPSRAPAGWSIWT